MSKKEELDKWVKENYTGQFMSGPPSNWNPETEFFYKINELQYGPIKWKDVPEEFKNNI
jgi:hypothetical protein